ncbi:MAG TPA: hypothetical protein VK816_00450 [Jatrophihabitantaceae bacterium]|jgi:hypothetical protein|nr:hypothetical protein [Jatrophihabitantaceae bacterium]
MSAARKNAPVPVAGWVIPPGGRPCCPCCGGPVVWSPVWPYWYTPPADATDVLICPACAGPKDCGLPLGSRRLEQLELPWST